jgi:hypothetical protein
LLLRGVITLRVHHLVFREDATILVEEIRKAISKSWYCPAPLSLVVGNMYQVMYKETFLADLFPVTLIASTMRYFVFADHAGSSFSCPTGSEISVCRV